MYLSLLDRWIVILPYCGRLKMQFAAVQSWHFPLVYSWKSSLFTIALKWLLFTSSIRTLGEVRASNNIASIAALIDGDIYTCAVIFCFRHIELILQFYNSLLRVLLRILTRALELYYLPNLVVAFMLQWDQICATDESDGFERFDCEESFGI